MADRRQFLGLLAGTVLGSAVRVVRAEPPAPERRPRIRAVVFDLFTIFDPRSVIGVAESVVPDHAGELCESWRSRLFEYSWIHTAAGQYRDFHALTEDALMYAARTHGIQLSVEARRTLVSAYERLAPWPDSRAALEMMKSAGLRLAPLANFTPAMIENLLQRASLRSLFDVLISTDRAQTFKPDPRAYALGPSVLGLRREEIAFAAFGGWDAAGHALEQSRLDARPGSISIPCGVTNQVDRRSSGMSSPPGAPVKRRRSRQTPTPTPQRGTCPSSMATCA